MYNVKQVAKICEVNEETVRRWIRSKKLKSERTSKKGGNYILKEDLKAFMNSNPKYSCALSEEDYIDRLNYDIFLAKEQINFLQNHIKDLQKEIKFIKKLNKSLQ